jgi:molybdopterin molybdotransferase
VRISTGAAVPAGASAVIRQEDVSAQQGRITTAAAVAEGQNIRRAGEVMRPGELVLPAGAALGPPELGAAVTAGVARLSVYRRPRVSVLCTGDELREPGSALGPGEIHNSNGPMLVGYALHAGATAAGPRVLADERTTTVAELESALEQADVVIVSGGVSVGPHDHVKPALAELGVSQEFWGVALQPGKPAWFGTRDRTLVFGLPGNPVSAAVTFALFVAPALRTLGGHPDDSYGPREAQLEGDPIRQNRLREQALRVRLGHRNGAAIARVNGEQGSHVITSLLGADALALIPPGEGQIEPGTTLALRPLARYTPVQ